MDYSTLKHPTYEVLAVYNADYHQRVIVELSNNWWGLYGILNGWAVNKNGGQPIYTRAEMEQLGWGPNLTSPPLWIKPELVKPVSFPKIEPKPELPELPDYYPFPNPEAKRRYYYGDRS